jgi:cytochrome c peroxidase
LVANAGSETHVAAATSSTIAGSSGPRSARVTHAPAAEAKRALEVIALYASDDAGTARVELGKALFFDPRLSGTGQMACARDRKSVV